MRPSSQPPSLWDGQNKQLQWLKKYGTGWEKIVLFPKCHLLLRTELRAFCLCECCSAVHNKLHYEIKSHNGDYSGGMPSLYCQWRGSIALKPDLKTPAESTSLKNLASWFSYLCFLKSTKNRPDESYHKELN